MACNEQKKDKGVWCFYMDTNCKVCRKCKRILGLKKETVSEKQKSTIHFKEKFSLREYPETKEDIKKIYGSLQMFWNHAISDFHKRQKDE
jgi:ethanolamine ammonia-lyase large subunit